MKKVRILSIDGGGIKGIIPGVVLEHVEKKFQEFSGNPNARIADYFDFIAGTSTGGILTLCYLMPNLDKETSGPISKYTVSEVLGFYLERGNKIFNQSKRRSWFGIRQLINAAKYCPNALEDAFEEYLGNLRMHQMLKPCIIPSYNLNDQTSCFFDTLSELNKDFYVKDIARSTSAAPTYFAPANILSPSTGTRMVNIDGGVFANNPVLSAYAECRNMVFPQVSYPTAKDMMILSIGTGGGTFDLPNLQKSNRWSILNWATLLPHIMMDGGQDTVAYQINSIFDALSDELKNNYKRIEVPIDKRTYSPDIAEASKRNVDALVQAGNYTIESANQESYGLDDFIKALVQND